MTTPKPIQSLAENFQVAFTKPSLARISIFVMAAILTTGAKTVSNVMRTAAVLSLGHASSFHRLFSLRRWQPWTLSRLLMVLIFKTFYAHGETIRLTGDDTVDGHKGKNVFGKGCHRDAVRSTHTYTAFRWGHKWVVLSILVMLPMTNRFWALPCMVSLYRTKKDNVKEGRKHKTPPDLMRQMLLQVLRWFPREKFIFCGDQGYAKHQLARLGVQYKGRIAIISRFYPNANLYLPPPLRVPGAGRPRRKGAKLPSPEKIVAGRKRRQTLRVSWYGGGRREIGVISGAGHWYKSGGGLVAVKWVNVEDRTGTHRAEYFFTTDPSMTPKDVVEIYTSRWSLEVTFEEMRSYLGLETTRGWIKNTILRTAPFLFGLYSLTVLIYERLPKVWQEEFWINWQGKENVCFSDVVTSVRCYLWQEWVFANLPGYAGVAKLPRKLRLSLLHALAPAA
jgi:hypothetical protein